MSARPATDDALPHGARVLVVRLSALGDVLFALETVASLKAERPDVRIDFLVEDRFAAILDRHPELDAVRTVPRLGRRGSLRALRALRRTRYDVVLDVHGLLKSAVPVLACRARLKLGFAPPASREGAHHACGVRVALPDPLPHRAERGPFLLRALGLRGAPAPAALPAPPAPVDVFGVAPRPRVVLHPGTSAFAAFKRWPLEKFAALAAGLVADGVHVAVSFGPGEGAFADAIAARVPATQRIDGAALGLLGLAAAFREADVVVAADTGPLHVAAAAGAAVVALFGPKDARLYGPRAPSGRARILFHDVPCRPCTRRRCASPQCILALPVDAVRRAVDELLTPQRA